MPTNAAHTVDRARLTRLMAEESDRFRSAHPRSAELFGQAKHSLLDGVPMNWMSEWASPYPLFVDTASGASFRCVDGHDYVDFCLGDTGAMAGHGPAATIAAVERQMRRGITHMLPTEDAMAAGEELFCRLDTRRSPSDFQRALDASYGITTGLLLNAVAVNTSTCRNPSGFIPAPLWLRGA